MALNVSGPSIGDETFVSQFTAQLREARLPADCITVEITEQAAVSNLARANAMIAELKAFGCQFALDDFGTGANSLTTLNNLQISRIKIDGSFVRKVADGPQRTLDGTSHGRTGARSFDRYRRRVRRNPRDCLGGTTARSRLCAGPRFRQGNPSA